MKIKNNYFLKDREGEIVICRKFLFLPVKFKNDGLTRWLEYANIVCKVKKFFKCYDAGIDEVWDFIPIRFATEEDLKQYPKETKKQNYLLWMILSFLFTIPLFFYNVIIGVIVFIIVQLIIHCIFFKE